MYKAKPQKAGEKTREQDSTLFLWKLWIHRILFGKGYRQTYLGFWKQRSEKVLAGSNAEEKNPVSSKKWEYKVIEFTSEIESEYKKIGTLPSRWFKTPNIEHLLNKYGSHGWELVSIETLVNYQSENFIVIGVFKRERNGTHPE